MYTLPYIHYHTYIHYTDTQTQNPYMYNILVSCEQYQLQLECPLSSMLDWWVIQSTQSVVEDNRQAMEL